MNPPSASKRSHITEIHGLRLVDEYAWLRDRENPEVIAYLEDENRYTDTLMASTEAFQGKLYDELLGRIKEDDSTVPYRDGPYLYYSRTEAKRPYRIYCRKRGDGGAEEILLDVNALSEGHEYTSVGLIEVSPDHKILAYSVDHDGSERFELRFLNLETAETVSETIENTSYSGAWANDNRTFFYVTLDEATRPYKLHRHVLGGGVEDELIFHEENDAYFLGVDKTLSEAYLVLELGSAVTSELWVLDANEPASDFRLVRGRKQGVEYDLVHHEDRFFIRTNDGATNFKLMEASASDPSEWQEFVGHREDVTLSDMAAFSEHLVLFERANGLPRLTVQSLKTGESHVIGTDEASYDLWFGDNAQFKTSVLRFEYTSPVTPVSTFDYDMNSRSRVLKKQIEVIGYDRERYETQRLTAIAGDGVEVPMTIVSKKGLLQDGKAPALLFGYGAYGMSYDASFVSSWISLLDRGFVVGIAHIRGGGEMGRRWKESGKFEHKKNTFTDFIACAEHLVEAGYTSSDRLAISGRSAGGLLMGAVTNMRPDLFHTVVAGVPFVDVVNTMLDETIPLTVIEWEEWGNPNDRKFFDIIRSYSPYDNVEVKAYPHMLVLSGLNDPRVAYWEPTKWTAKLRAHKTDDNLLLLKTNMGAGHGGASGRYGRLKERAFEYAFILDRVGITQ